MITEGEYDAMAVHQATGIHAISVPNGASSLPISILPLLEDFKEIILWMDDDIAGYEAAQKFAKKLGKYRCRVVSPPTNLGFPFILSSSLHSFTHNSPKLEKIPKDANDAFRMGLNLRELIDGARRFTHSKIANFSEYKNVIFRELVDPRQVAGFFFFILFILFYLWL